MLILTRKTDESIIIGNNIQIKVLKIQGNQVHIGIDAPKVDGAANALIPKAHAMGLLAKFLSSHKPVFIFTPTIGKCEDLFAFISKWVRNGNYVHSKRQEREEIIDSFRQGICRYLVTTAVLERGVTLKNLQVIIFESDHAIYTKSALVQIAGRVGRKKDAPDGEVIFLSDKKTEAMVGATSEIRAKNSHL